MLTHTKTYPYTFTRAQVISMQYRIALEIAKVMSDAQLELVMEAIDDKKISAVGIYAYDVENGKNTRVAEVEIRVDWDEHKRQIKLTGEAFNYDGGGFDHSTGEAAETKVYVGELVRMAKKQNLRLSCWVVLSSSLNDEEYKRTLSKIGFTGGRPPQWNGEPEANLDKSLAIPELEYIVRY